MISQGPKGKSGIPKEMIVLIFMVFALVALVGAVGFLNWQGGVQPATPGIPTEPEFAPADEFDPLDKMDAEFLENYTWDHTQLAPHTGVATAKVRLRKEAHDLMAHYEALLHAVRFVRTLKKSAAQPEGGFAPLSAKDYMGLISTPYNYRGKTFRITGRFHEHFNNYDLPDDQHARAAGASKLSCIYFRDRNVLRDPFMRQQKRDLGHKTETKVFLVVSPHDLRPLLRERLATIDGVFVGRWPPDITRDFWLPVIVTLVPEKEEVTEASSGLVLKIVLAAVIVMIGGLILFGQRDRAIKRKKKRHLAPPDKPATDKPDAAEEGEAKPDAEEKAETDTTDQRAAEEGKPSEDKKEGDKPSEKEKKPSDEKDADKSADKAAAEEAGESKDGEPKDSESKDGESKEGASKEGASKDGESKEGESKGGESKDGKSKEGESAESGDSGETDDGGESGTDKG